MLSDNIARLRLRLNMSQQELCEKCGVSITSVKSWESGRSQPKAENVYMLSKVLGVKLDELFDMNDNEYIYVGSIGESERRVLIELAQLFINNIKK